MMRNTNKSINISAPHRLSFIPNFSTSSLWVAQGGISFSSFPELQDGVVSMGDNSPKVSPASSSHRLQFFMTCSSMALLGSQLPCHQSFARYTHYILLLGSAMSSAHHFLESFPVSLLSCHCVYLPRKWCQFTEVQCLYKSALCWKMIAAL